ncbi:phosphate transport system regulatory protein PhoU [Oscillospiraceae bacterium]|nr:phosphate transport system regulatory protein PhoU [Oscillospiraceae bacterium]BDF74138.1 phosphate transport system regulatory protein PhoU [Oscillospiraceae bacterium]
MRKTFDAELLELGTEMIDMAAAAEDAIDVVTASLTADDGEAARAAIEMTRSMDQMERDIENRCLRLLLQQQPVARDLRTISAALKMVTDLQRIGDQCANIAEISLLLSRGRGRKDLAHIRTMSQKAGVMVKRAIYAYVNRDKEAAQAVIALDDGVDALFQTVKAELVELIVSSREQADQAIDLIIIAKYLERIADHAVNIAQWAIYCVTGELVAAN